MRVLRRLRWLFLVIFLAVCGTSQAQVLVAAASDLRSVLPELIEKFQATSPHRIKPSYASSGVLFTQLMQGAPFQLFLSADRGFVQRLAVAGKTKDAGHDYAQGRLLLVLPVPLKLASSDARSELETVRQALVAFSAASNTKFAIPNPEHAPYGIKAREVLQALGLWSSLQSRLVIGDNAAQAGQFLLGGHAHAGLMPASLLKTHTVPAHLQGITVPDTLHSPLIQRMVLLKNAEPGAQAFYDFLRSDPAKDIFKQHGFDTTVSGT